MPRFYFDIRDRTGTRFDVEGIVFDDLDAARTDARRALAEMIADDITKSGTGSICIEIRTDSGISIVEVVGATDDRPLK